MATENLPQAASATPVRKLNLPASEDVDHVLADLIGTQPDTLGEITPEKTRGTASAAKDVIAACESVADDPQTNHLMASFLTTLTVQHRGASPTAQ